MATDVVMPRLSDTMDSGKVARWLKHEGDEIKRGDIIAEIETDKANMELESYSSGVLALIIVGEGQSAALGAPIAVIAANAEEAKRVNSTPHAAAETATAPPSAAATPRTATENALGDHPNQDIADQGPPATLQTGGAEPEVRVKASPLARRLAREHGVQLRALAGTGPGGRITKEDVESYLRQAAPMDGLRQQTVGNGQQPGAQDAPHQQAGAGGIRGAQPVEMTRMQGTIARRMTEARFSAPDFVLTAEFDMTEARALLAGLATVPDAPRVGPNDLLIKALAGALAQHPEINSGWENGTVVRYGRVNVGFAVAIEDGLVVPVIRDAAQKTLGQISAEARGMIEKARAGRLAPSDYEGGTFSLSNLGMYGIDQFTPIINVPEACILGVGAIGAKPVVVDGAVVVRDRLRVTLACDHRVVNGAQGAEFLRTVRRLLEHPLLALL